MGARPTIAVLPKWFPHYSDPGCHTEIRAKLLEVGKTTAEAWITAERVRARRRENTGTVRTLRLRKQFPIAVNDSGVDGPGHLQVDSVSHDGSCSSGQYAWSINVTDIASGWTVTFAVSHKDPSEIVKGLKRIEEELPFRVRSWRFDSGTEFITEEMYNEFMGSRAPEAQVKVCRGRPYHKNDQCYVEQKNDDIVRRLFRYGRIDGRQMIPIMNHAYRLWNHLHNAFVPQQKRVRKFRKNEGCGRKYDDAKTPVDRLLDFPVENVDERQRLLDLVEGVDPFDLRKRSLDAVRKVYTFLLGNTVLRTRETG